MSSDETKDLLFKRITEGVRPRERLPLFFPCRYTQVHTSKHCDARVSIISDDCLLSEIIELKILNNGALSVYYIVDSMPSIFNSIATIIDSNDRTTFQELQLLLQMT